MITHDMVVREKGWQARIMGLDRTSNPYATGGGWESDDFRFWDDGWVSADDEIRLEKAGFKWDGESQ